MIQVCIEQHDGIVESITISGHAESAPYGQDLVCAAVSAIGFGLGNALDELGSDAETQIEDNVIHITVKSEDALTQTILRTGIIQLKTVQETNSRFIKIKEKEV